MRARIVFGEQHPLTLACAANLAADLRAENADEEAERLLEETIRHYTATLGADHPEAMAAAAGERLNPDFDPPPI